MNKRNLTSSVCLLLCVCLLGLSSVMATSPLNVQGKVNVATASQSGASKFEGIWRVIDTNHGTQGSGYVATGNNNVVKYEYSPAPTAETDPGVFYDVTVTRYDGYLNLDWGTGSEFVYHDAWITLEGIIVQDHQDATLTITSGAGPVTATILNGNEVLYYNGGVPTNNTVQIKLTVATTANTGDNDILITFITEDTTS